MRHNVAADRRSGGRRASSPPRAASPQSRVAAADRRARARRRARCRRAPTRPRSIARWRAPPCGSRCNAMPARVETVYTVSGPVDRAARQGPVRRGRRDRHGRRARAQPRIPRRSSRPRWPTPASRSRCARARRGCCSTASTYSMRAACWARSSPQQALALGLAHLHDRVGRSSAMNAHVGTLTTSRRSPRRAFRDDVFAGMRRENLARWPTGAGVDLDEAVARHQALPKHKQLAWVLRRAVAERRCLTQPRGGFGTFALQLRADGDARQDGPRRHRADDDRQLHAQRALRAGRKAASRNRRRRGPLDAERLSDGQLRRGGEPAS